MLKVSPEVPFLMKTATPTAIQARPAVRGAVAEFVAAVRAADGAKVQAVVLYGSVARGEARPDSDVDLLVRWGGEEPEGRAIVDAIADGIFLRTGVLVAPLVVAGTHWQHLVDIESMFLANIQREGIVVEG